MPLVRRIINPSPPSLWNGRALAVALLLGLASSQVAAQSEEDKRQVPASVAREISQADEVVITEEGDRRTYEYKANGQLRLIRVVPAAGPEYYLTPEDQSLESDMDQSDSLIVRWKLLEF